MAKVRLLQVNDVHIQDQRYGSRTDDCIETVLRKLDFVYDLALERCADVFNTGDLFNKKDPWRVSHRLVQLLADFFDGWAEQGVNTYLLAGTHDMANGRIESLNRQPLGALLKASSIRYIKPGLNVFRSHFDGEFAVWGAPGVYNLDKEDGQQAYVFPVDEAPEVKNRVTMSHGMLLRPTETFFDGYTSMAWVAKQTSAVLHMNGHPHWYMGMTNLKAPNSPTGKCVFSNPGSLYRVSAAKENQTRDILTVYFELTDGRVTAAEEVIVPSLPFADTFVSSVQQPESEWSGLEELAEMVDAAAVDLATATNAEEMLRVVKETMDPSPEVYECVARYLRAAEEEL